MYMNTYIQIRVYTFTLHVCIYSRAYEDMQQMHLDIYTFIDIYMYIHTYIRIYIYIYIC